MRIPKSCIPQNNEFVSFSKIWKKWIWCLVFLTLFAQDSRKISKLSLHAPSALAMSFTFVEGHVRKIDILSARVFAKFMWRCFCVCVCLMSMLMHRLEVAHGSWRQCAFADCSCCKCGKVLGIVFVKEGVFPRFSRRACSPYCLHKHIFGCQRRRTRWNPQSWGLRWNISRSCTKDRDAIGATNGACTPFTSPTTSIFACQTEK